MTSIVYTSDRGDRFLVTAMDTSHLLNVIGHHLDQRDTLTRLGLLTEGNLRKTLDDVIELLTDELRNRTLALDDYFSPHSSEGSEGTDYA